MKKYLKYYIAVLVALIAVSCDEFEDPAVKENVKAKFSVERLDETRVMFRSTSDRTSEAGDIDTIIWSFSGSAALLAGSKDDAADSVTHYDGIGDSVLVSFPLLDSTVDYGVSMVVGTANEGGVDEIVSSVRIEAQLEPAPDEEEEVVFTVPDVPVGDACTETFAANPDCFCNDPANVADANCTLINVNGDFENSDGLAIADNWTIQVNGTDGIAPTTREELGGSNALKFDIQAVTTETDSWRIQAINEANDQEGFDVAADRQWLFSVDVYASKAGMKAMLAPGKAASDGYGDYPGNQTFDLVEGWQHLSVIGAEPTVTKLRAQVNLNFAENAGGIIVLDNYKVIDIGPQ